MRRLNLILVVLFACSLSVPAMAGPTDADLRERIDAFNAWSESTPPAAMRQEFPAKLRELVDSVPVGELNADQVGMFGAYLLRDGRHIADAMGVAEAQAKQGGADGAVGEVVAAWLWMRQQRVPPEASELATILDHDGLDEALAAGRAHQVFELGAIFASNRPESQVRPHLDKLSALIEKVPADGKYESALLGAHLYEAVTKYTEDHARKEALKGHVLGALASAKAALGVTQPRIVQAIDQSASKLSFIGGPAPALTFSWTSDGLDASTLEDLKGNVVVLDFWATWCGPCIAAFPKVRDLVAHYEGYPVKVIGVTNLQGRHTNPDGTRVNTSGNPAREFELMSEFMDQKDMTWPVAFTASPDDSNAYFVESIPHLTFIAPDGTVRFNKLNPHFLSEEEEHAMIDGMLREFGLPTPSDHSESAPTD